MSHGFLGYDASLMLDVVVTTLVLIVPALAFSVMAAKRRRYDLHRNLQVGLAAVLLVAVAAFEIDLQVVHDGWINVANKNPDEPRLVGPPLELARTALRVHLVFAVSTPVLWAATLALAFRRYPNPPRPGSHSRRHKTLGWLSVIDLVLTTATGLTFYYVAFVVR